MFSLYYLVLALLKHVTSLNSKNKSYNHYVCQLAEQQTLKKNSSSPNLPFLENKDFTWFEMQTISIVKSYFCQLMLFLLLSQSLVTKIPPKWLTTMNIAIDEPKKTIDCVCFTNKNRNQHDLPKLPCSK